MEAAKTEPTAVCHVVALPYPGRGHINPMMNLCKQLVSKAPDILITFIITEEWLGFIGSDPKPSNISYATIPNVIPSELIRGKDFPGFVEAVGTKMGAPVEDVLDRLEPPVTAIVIDPYLVWAVGLGNRRNIPVASLWTMSPSVFSVFHHFELLHQNGQFLLDFSGALLKTFNFNPVFFFISIPFFFPLETVLFYLFIESRNSTFSCRNL